MGIIYQYQIYLIDLEPTIGSEMQKVRPCVVISPDEINHNLQVVTIAPITSNTTDYLTRVNVNLNDKKGKIVLEQIKTIDKIRLKKYLGNLSKAEVKSVKLKIKEIFVD